MYVCMYETYSNSDRSISMHTQYKVNFMIHTAATSCPQVNMELELINTSKMYQKSS